MCLCVFLCVGVKKKKRAVCEDPAETHKLLIRRGAEEVRFTRRMNQNTEIATDVAMISQRRNSTWRRSTPTRVFEVLSFSAPARFLKVNGKICCPN